MQRSEVVVRIERADQLRLRDGMIPAVRHVLLARPNQLHRCAGNLLSDRHSLLHEIVGRAPAEAAAERHLVNVAFGNRQAGSFSGGGQRGLAVLRRRPYLAAIRRIYRGRVHRLHSRVILIRKGVDGLDLLHSVGDRLLGIAVLVADERLLSIKTALEQLRDGGARDFCIVALVPAYGHCIEGSLRLPPAIGHDGNSRLTDLKDVPDTLLAVDLAASKLTSLPPNTGQSLIAAQSIPGSFTSKP